MFWDSIRNLDVVDILYSVCDRSQTRQLWFYYSSLRAPKILHTPVLCGHNIQKTPGIHQERGSCRQQID